jgi:ABC transporter substrate binding protein
MPAVGFLYSDSADATVQQVAWVRGGLAAAGYVEGQSVRIEYRWANNQYDRLPELAADLVQRRVVAIIAAGALNAAVAAKEATKDIPIVFLVGSDPVQIGLVASLNRPGGNITGVTLFNTELLAKRLELLRELVPNAATIGLLVNPNNPNTEPNVKELQALAQSGGWLLHVVAARDDSELDAACQSAPNFGSDSISMSFAGGMGLFSERNQHHVHQFSDFLSRSRRTDCRKRHSSRGCCPRDGSGRYPGGNVSSVSLAFAARSQPLCSAGFGPAMFRLGRTPSGRGPPVFLQYPALPETDFRRAL